MNDLGVFLLSCDAVPAKWHEPLYVPLLMTIVGLTVFGLGTLSEARELKPKPWKWASMLFLGLGLYSGGSVAYCVTDSFYRSSMNDYGKKMMLGHIAGFAIPFLAILALAIYQWRASRDPYRN